MRTTKIASALILLLATACNEGGTEIEGVNLNPENYFDVNMFSLNRLVCDPFGGGGNQTPNGGLKANLYYLEDGSTPLSHVADYFTAGTKSDKIIFFSQINVPTRLFNLGFPTETGNTISKDSGETLIENFALEIETVIKLGPNDEPGLYELALLSDDGSVLQVRDAGTYVTVVDNDGTHPTRFGCASRSIQMNADDSYIAKIHYYQGPRDHISVIPMWRKISSDSEVGTDVSCGQQGNSMYFDYNNNSAPKAAYNGLLARGWKPLDSNNYELPASIPINPCTNGTAPIITNIAVRDMYDGQIQVVWNTNIPATAQVLVVNMDTGQELLTYSDNVLRTEHEVFVQGLQRNVNYMVQAVSVSDTYGKTISYAYNLVIR
ncbi:MAG: hypothetical protein KDD37_03880 [Bdellovibrionales bacterium]|nr:hypothetical protein [Bdellovibrionales bacterium]